MKKTFLILMILAALAMVGGCATSSGSSLTTPTQDTGSVESAAVAAQQATAAAVIPTLANLTSTITIPRGKDASGNDLEPAVVRLVDSSLYVALAKMVDYSAYKSPPGFWSFMTALIPGMRDVALVIAPWWGVTELAGKMGTTTNTTNSIGGSGVIGSGSYSSTSVSATASGAGAGIGVATGGGAGTGSGSYAPATTTTTTTTTGN